MINFEISKNDIKKALSNNEFLSKYNIRYHEAIFMRYLRDSKEITVEQMDILTNKYKISNRISISNLCINNDLFKDKEHSYGLFNNYLENITFDKYAMFEIILAAKAFFYPKNQPLNYDIFMVAAIYRSLFENVNVRLSDYKNLKLCEDFEKEYCDVLKNHELAELVKCGNDDYYYSNIDSKLAKKELEEYSKIYGDEKVKVIKKYVAQQNFHDNSI